MRKKKYNRCYICRNVYITWKGKGKIPKGVQEYPVRQNGSQTCCTKCSKEFNTDKVRKRRYRAQEKRREENAKV